MRVFRLIFLFLLPLKCLMNQGEDETQGADSTGIHQLERLVELLTSKECEDLVLALSYPEENIFKHLERLSPENNQFNLKHQVKRDGSSHTDRETECRTALTDWLLKYGEQTYYDRLSRALQHIGRADIAVEVAKNMNQEKVLSLKRFVEDYHEYVSSLKLPLVQPETDDHRRVRRVRDVTWHDLDLIVERAPFHESPRQLLDEAWPLLWGFLVGFGGTILIALPILLFLTHVSRSGHKKLSHVRSTTRMSTPRPPCGVHRYINVTGPGVDE